MCQTIIQHTLESPILPPRLPKMFTSGQSVVFIPYARKFHQSLKQKIQAELQPRCWTIKGNNIFVVLATVGTKWRSFQCKPLFRWSEGVGIKVDCINVLKWTKRAIDERAFVGLKSTPQYAFSLSRFQVEIWPNNEKSSCHQTLISGRFPAGQRQVSPSTWWQFAALEERRNDPVTQRW